MKDRRGLTLIEVVISMAIISIMAVTILGVFNISITNIFKSGRRTEEVLNLKRLVDEKLAYYQINYNEINMDEENENDEKIKFKEIKEPIIVHIPGIDPKYIAGILINNVVSKNNFNVQIETFVPNKKQDSD